MLRSIRVPILASFVALMFFACGGGDGGSHPKDGGQDDGGKVQFDAQKDGLPPQQDASGSEGGTGACVPTGGEAHAAVCTNSKPCTCPEDCVKLNATSKSGGCFASTDTGCGTNEAWIGGFPLPDPEKGYCFTTAAISGTFTVPIDASAAPAGTYTVAVNINGANANFSAAVGFAEHDTTNGTWDIYIFNQLAAAGSTQMLWISMSDAQYNTTTPVPLDGTSAASAMVRLETDTINGSGTTTAAVINGYNWKGTITLTAAPTTGNIVGSFSADAIMFGITSEMCGPNTAAC